MKSERQKLIKKLDTIFSKYIRLSNCDKDGNCICVSCGKKDNYKNMHNAHWISRGCLQYRFSEINCKPACPGCNTYRPEYHIREYTVYQIQTLGIDKVNEMRENSKKLYKISTNELQELIKVYSIKVKDLLTKLQ